MTNPTDYKTIQILFEGMAGDAKDIEIMEILDNADGEFLGSGTFLGEPMQRDLQFSVHKDRVKVITKALKALGVNVSIE